jgi:hypothetical protein
MGNPIDIDIEGIEGERYQGFETESFEFQCAFAMKVVNRD